MSNLRDILRFGWPYLRRYRTRFIAGVLLGLVFSLANGLIFQCAGLIKDRLDPRPTPQVEQASAAPDTPTVSIMTSIQHRWVILKDELVAAVDPWIPRAGQPIDTRQGLGLLLLFPLLMAFRGFTGYLSSYCLGWVSERVINELQVDVLKKLQTLSLDYFNKSQLGDLTSRVQSDTSHLHRSLNLGLSDLVKEPSTVLVLLISLLWLDPLMTLLVLVLVPFCVLPIRALGKRVRKAMAGSVKTKVSQSSLLLEMLSGIRAVKAFGLEQQQLDRFSCHARELVRFGVKGVQARELVNPIIETVTALIAGVLLILLVRSGRQPSEILLFLGGLIAAYTPLKKIASLHILFEQSSAGVKRLAQILEEQPTVKEPTSPASLHPFTQEIRFENVSFDYGQREVLRDIQLVIPYGQKLGVAGESGSGKSTLLNLLFRFYDPTRGRVTLDGIDLRTVNTSDLRAQMALVSQDVMLFDQTIAENIACGRLNATEGDIQASARAAFAHEFIMECQGGYQARVSERGVNFSGGQRQRLAIARAFVRNAPILVLDEATASLDSQSEAEVQKSIDALAEHRTVVCVAHRLSTLAGMDRIIVLEKGQIIEDGTFQSLIAKGGVFAGMAGKQGLRG